MEYFFILFFGTKGYAYMYLHYTAFQNPQRCSLVYMSIIIILYTESMQMDYNKFNAICTTI